MKLHLNMQSKYGNSVRKCLITIKTAEVSSQAVYLLMKQLLPRNGYDCVSKERTKQLANKQELMFLQLPTLLYAKMRIDWLVLLICATISIILSSAHGAVTVAILFAPLIEDTVMQRKYYD